MAKKKKVQEAEEEEWTTTTTAAEDEWDEPQESTEPSEEDWDAVPAAPPLTLNIEKHEGAFDKHTTKILIYGESGTGKTRLASTMPAPLFVDVDHGMSSVTEQVEKVYIHDDDRGFKEMESVYKFLAAGDHDFETVVLDTLNEMQRVIMRYTLDEFTSVRRSYGSLPGMSDYGFMLRQFLELTQKFISLPMRVVLLAQVNSMQFETDILMPLLIGKNTAREIARKMDVIGYIYKAQEGDHMIHAVSFDSANYVTKDRSNRLPTVINDASYGSMAAYWD